MSLRVLRQELVIATLLCAAAIIGIDSVRDELFLTHKQVKERHDVYVLPPPDQLVTLSLGYRAAVADLLWAHVLVSQGLHTFERRRFDNLTLLYDAINALDPTWRTPYLLSDALVTFQMNETPHKDVLKARVIMERGVKNRPNDGELWLNLGHFVGYLAPSSYLTDEAEAQQWRRDSVPMMARAAELGAGADSFLSWQAISGAGMLARRGELAEAIRFYRRTLMVTDDDELKDYIVARLRALEAQLDVEIRFHRRALAATEDSERKRYIAAKLAELLELRDVEKWKQRADAFKQRARRGLPYLTSKDRGLVLGPPSEPAACAGPGHQDEAQCAPTWRDWYERLDKQDDREPR